MISKYLDKQGVSTIISSLLGRLDEMDASWATTLQTLTDNIEQATEVVFGEMEGTAPNLYFYKGTYDSDWTYEDAPVTPNTHTLYIDVTNDNIYRWGGQGYVTMLSKVPESTIYGWFDE